MQIASMHAYLVSYMLTGIISKGAGGGVHSLRFDPEGEEEFAIELNPFFGGGGQLSHKNVSANIRFHIQYGFKA
jgi:hypothetical protein